MSARTLFFCLGPPKSGTTFLQRTLDLHPQVSCPSEHQFDLLSRRLRQVLDDYDARLSLVDRRTGLQGTKPMAKKIHASLVTQTILFMMMGAAGRKPIVGANDNAILSQLDDYERLFDSPKFLIIFRHPIDVAVSAWHHNHRLAREENDERHVRLMTRHGGFEDWIRVCAKNFDAHARHCHAFARTHSNVLLIRYEDLVRDKIPALERIFGFLGAQTQLDLLNHIAEQSSLENMRKQSGNAAFFRAGSVTGTLTGSVTQANQKQQTKAQSERRPAGETPVSEQLRAEAEKIAEHGLKLLGYR